MSRKRYTPEQIIGMLREAEVWLSQGQTIGETCRGFGVSEQSYYRPFSAMLCIACQAMGAANMAAWKSARHIG